MVEEAVGDVIGGAVEVAAEVLGEIGSSADDSRRKRRGCWRLFLIVLVVALIVGGVIALNS